VPLLVDTEVVKSELKLVFVVSWLTVGLDDTLAPPTLVTWELG
jgi:hypothetical protein